MDIETVQIPFSSENQSKKRIKISNFLITFNTNVQIKESAAKTEEIANKLADIITDTLKNNIISTIQFLNKGESFNSDLIKDISINISPEIGLGSNKGKRLHAHATVTIYHYSKIRLNPGMITKLVNKNISKEEFPYDVSYLHISASGPTPQQYLEKWGKNKKKKNSD